jgi:hypothetical protein
VSSPDGLGLDTPAVRLVNDITLGSEGLDGTIVVRGFETADKFSVAIMLPRTEGMMLVKGVGGMEDGSTFVKGFAMETEEVARTLLTIDGSTLVNRLGTETEGVATTLLTTEGSKLVKMIGTTVVNVFPGTATANDNAVNLPMGDAVDGIETLKAETERLGTDKVGTGIERLGIEPGTDIELGSVTGRLRLENSVIGKPRLEDETMTRIELTIGVGNATVELFTTGVVNIIELVTVDVVLTGVNPAGVVVLVELTFPVTLLVLMTGKFCGISAMN